MDNPHLHPIAGAPPPKQRSRVPGVVQTARFVAMSAGPTVLFLFHARTGDAYDLVFGGLFSVMGLFIGMTSVWSWCDRRWPHRNPEHTVATVTHSWEEWVTRGPGSSTNSRRVEMYPYTVHFQLPDGREIHRRTPMATSSIRYAPGRQIDVAYGPSTPTDITVGRGFSAPCSRPWAWSSSCTREARPPRFSGAGSPPPRPARARPPPP